MMSIEVVYGGSLEALFGVASIFADCANEALYFFREVKLLG
jgi:hypothetical protein